MLIIESEDQRAKYLKLLKRGKEILSDQDRLVDDWWHTIEYQGKPFYSFLREEFTPQKAKHCKACIVGGIYLSYVGSKHYEYMQRVYLADLLGDIVCYMDEDDDALVKRHTVKQVQKYYDRAIKLVETAKVGVEISI